MTPNIKFINNISTTVHLLNRKVIKNHCASKLFLSSVKECAMESFCCYLMFLEKRDDVGIFSPDVPNIHININYNGFMCH